MFKGKSEERKTNSAFVYFAIQKIQDRFWRGARKRLVYSYYFNTLVLDTVTFPPKKMYKRIKIHEK